MTPVVLLRITFRACVQFSNVGLDILKVNLYYINVIVHFAYFNFYFMFTCILC